MIVPAKRGEIHLGDLARALASLDWRDDEQAKAIGACLGFGIESPPSTRPRTEIYDRRRYPRRATGPEPPPTQPRVPLPEVEPPPALPANLRRSSLYALSERVPAVPEDIDWLEREDALYSERKETCVARQTLFPERTNRHILSAALATLRSGAEIDVPRLIAAICRQEVVADLPRRSESTLERGCQLLLDYSSTMVPFWEDLSGLIGQVADVVGAANTPAFSFETRPTEAIRWTRQGGREPWQPDGRPVLAATDFGIQGTSDRAEPDPAWRTLTERCAGERIPLIVLIPWPEARWPLDIGGRPELVHWSPHTSAAMIMQKVGRGHRVD
jgi:hypothetical protein